MHRIPDLTAEVVGYRSFQVKNNELRGKYADVAWSLGVTVAKCCPESFKFETGGRLVQKQHRAPLKECRCGLHAHYTAQQLAASVLVGGDIAALVSCWGVVVPYAEGFRAEYGRIHALSDPYQRSTSRMVAETYGVPLVESLSDLCEFEAKAGRPLPYSMRGPS